METIKAILQLVSMQEYLKNKSTSDYIIISLIQATVISANEREY